MPKKKSANRLKKRWKKSACKKIEVINVQGSYKAKAGKKARLIQVSEASW